MRPWFNRMFAVVLALVGVAALAFSSATSTAVRLAANALIMDGTTFPTPSPGFIESAIDDFIVPTVGGSYTGIPVTTPEGVIGINQSVRDGLADLEEAMAQQDSGQPYVVFGFSQSSVIQTYEKIALAQRQAGGEPIPDVTFVGIGVGNRGNGGIAARLPGLVIPFFDFTFNGAAPTDTGIRTIDIARQYDGLADTPQFVTNPVALANAVLGVLFVHAFYGPEVSLDPTSPKYVPGTVVQTRGDTTYYWIPTEDLPLFDPLRLVGVPEGVLDIAEPFFRTLVEAGYDRTVPFGEPTPAQLIPVIDPVTFAVQLTRAVLEGANNAAALVGGALPGYDESQSRLQELEAATAETIGRPYRGVVRTLNAFNPILAFNSIEGPLVTAIDEVINATGVPRLLNQAIATVLFPVTAWAERNVLYPQGPPSDPIAALARQFLKPVLPHLDDDLDEVAPASTPVTGVSAPAVEQQEDEPKPRKRDTKRDARADDEPEQLAEKTDSREDDRNDDSAGNDADADSTDRTVTTDAPTADPADEDDADNTSDTSDTSDASNTSDDAGSSAAA